MFIFKNMIKKLNLKINLNLYKKINRNSINKWPKGKLSKK